VSAKNVPGLNSAGRVAAAMFVMNVATFAFNVIAARLTIPAEFGAITAMLGILLIASVVALALQATAARRIAVRPQDTDHLVALTARASWLTALTVGAVTAVSTIALTPLLRLDSYWPVALCGAAIVPLTVYGGQAGVAQGTSRWARLAWLYMAHGVGRLVVSTIALLIAPTATAAMVGIAAAAWIPVAAGRGLFRHSGAAAPVGGAVRFTREAVLAGSTLLGFLVLTNTDSLMSRAILDPHDSGLYAAGLIVTKSTLFLPQFVSVVLFPRMARDTTGRSQLLALAAVTGLGLSVVAGTALLPDLALVFVGGHRYEEIGASLWVFALAGTAQAVLHVLMFGAIARRNHAVTPVVWGAVIVLVGAAVRLRPGVVGLALIVVIACSIAAATLAIISVRHARRQPTPETDAAPATHR